MSPNGCLFGLLAVPWRILDTIRRRRRSRYVIGQLRLRCGAVPDHAPVGRTAVCGLREGHDGRHLWVLV